MRTIETMAKEGEETAILAIDMFVRRIKKYIGSYIALLGSVDAVIFTGGIGEHSATIRAKVLQNMEPLGLVMDTKKNSQHDISISQEESKIALFVISTDEELMIAKESYNLVHN